MTHGRSTRRPTVVDLVFGVLALAVPIGSAHRLLNTDGDLPRHLRMGEYILSGGPFQPDVFSHTRYGEPFLTTEWLSQVAWALAHRAGGLVGVAALAALLIALSYALVVLFLRRKGVDPVTAYLVTIAAAAFGSIHWLARPHLFTLLGCAVTLHLLESRPRPWVYLAVFATWANFHPGFVIGLTILAAYTAGEVLEGAMSAGRHAKRWREHALGVAIGTAGAMLTPQGPGFLLRIAGHLNDALLLAITQEFRSPSFHDGYGRALLILLVSVFALVAVRRTRPRLPRLLTVVLVLAGALVAQRNVPIFVMVALPLLAVDANAELRARTAGVLERIRRSFERAERPAITAWSSVPVIGLAALVASGGALGGARLVPDRFDAAVFPADAVARARAAGLDARLFNEFAWGGYILYAWPEQRIFIDGMTDFFGEEIARSYLRIALLQPGWRQELERHGIELAIVRHDSPIGYALDHDSGWAEWYGDDVAVVYRRAHGGASAGGGGVRP